MSLSNSKKNFKILTQTNKQKTMEPDKGMPKEQDDHDLHVVIIFKFNFPHFVQ